MDIRERLDRGEKLLWEGRPAQGLMLRPFDVVAIPFSLVWGGFVLFFFVAGLSAPSGSAHPSRWRSFPSAFSRLVFVSVAIYITVWPLRLRCSPPCAHAIRDYRIPRAHSLGVFHLDAQVDAALADLPIDVSGHDRGSLKFGPGYGFSLFRRHRGIWGWAIFMFERIENVHEVYNLVRDVQQGRH